MDYKIDGNNHVICKIKNYIYDTQKNRIVDGSDKESFKSYLLTFSRNINVISDYSITSCKYDWCLIEFKNIEIAPDMSYSK